MKFFENKDFLMKFYVYYIYILTYTYLYLPEILTVLILTSFQWILEINHFFDSLLNSKFLSLHTYLYYTYLISDFVNIIFLLN